ncbi:MAG: RND family efflux transporter MFP subunit [Paraglaciecola sp.]|jgi:RND family efflux transporter MFP subunit
MKKWLKTKLVLPAIALTGFLLMLFIIKLQPDMEHQLAERPSMAVNYVTVQAQMIRPEIIGFGTVKQDVNLQAKAEVSGRITYINPNLKKGEIFQAGTLLLTIDDKDYQLQLKQTEADVLANKANLKEMELTIENNQLELKLAGEKLNVRQQEYARLKKLKQSGAVSQSKLDQERQNLLQQQQEVQQLKNKETTLPSDLQVMKAQLAIAQAKLVRSLRDLDRTQVKLPFGGRISNVLVELDQYVATGASLFNASGLDKIVINAQFTMAQFSRFSEGFNREKLKDASQHDFINMGDILASMGLTARVEMANGQFQSWPAKVERFSDNLDPQSRTFGVTVSIEGNYLNIEPGKKPPLLEGMYMKVALLGAPQSFIAVPRFALHENELFRIAPDNTLQRVTVENLQLQGDLALLNEPLKTGDKIITSDVFPAVNGMTLQPIADKKAQQKLQQWLGDPL